MSLLNVLYIDDEPQLCYIFKRIFPQIPLMSPATQDTQKRLLPLKNPHRI